MDVIGSFLAVQMIYPPSNVRAVSENGAINITWVKPEATVIQFTIRLSHYPYLSHIDVPVHANTTSYYLKPVSHIGQNYSIRVRAETELAESDFTEEITVMTSNMQILPFLTLFKETIG